MADPGDLRAIALDLAAQFQLSPAEIDLRLSHARDPHYWTQLTPHLRIGADDALEPHAVDSAALNGAAGFFRRERYFELPQLLHARALSSMNGVIDAVVAAGWPPVFSLVSDQFWQCARLPAVRAIVESRLGRDAAQASQVWIHVVPAIDGSGGWMPHFDGFRDGRITVWLALSDSTLSNGCMYLVPPNSLPPGMRTMDMTAHISMPDVMATLHGARAMPVIAGAALGWDFDVLHWGGRAARPVAARRAVSLVFVGNADHAEPDETPLLFADQGLPSFEARLQSIARALKLYGGREPISRRFLPVARLLQEG
jgi:hypothetical protein